MLEWPRLLMALAGTRVRPSSPTRAAAFSGLRRSRPSSRTRAATFCGPRRNAWPCTDRRSPECSRALRPWAERGCLRADQDAELDEGRSAVRPSLGPRRCRGPYCHGDEGRSALAPCLEPTVDEGVPACRHRPSVRASMDLCSNAGRTTLQSSQERGAREGRRLLCVTQLRLVVPLAPAAPSVRRAQRHAAALSGPHVMRGPQVVAACRRPRPWP